MKQALSSLGNYSDGTARLQMKSDNMLTYIFAPEPWRATLCGAGSVLEVVRGLFLKRAGPTMECKLLRTDLVPAGLPAEVHTR